MIEREYNISDPGRVLEQTFKENEPGYVGVRRRAVLTFSNKRWALFVCTVEALTAKPASSDKTASRCYREAVLVEDWLTLDAWLDFVQQINAGRITLGNLSVEATDTNRHWNRELVPMSNYHMVQAGHVMTVRYESNRAGTYGALIAPDQPYYPDITEAARDWLPFPIFHGNSDAHNGEVVFLLPETRAYFMDARPRDEVVDVYIEGTQAGELALMVKGAWWKSGRIQHFDVPVRGNHAELPIPPNATKLEYVLIDTEGNLYDFQYEDERGHSGLGTKRLLGTDAELAEIVLKACRDGEGSLIEFKPFIELEKGYKGTKLGEVAETVVAFANARGGRIFLGIDDDCSISGIDEKLSEWAKSPADEAACETYLGALRAKLRDVVIGETGINCLQTVVNGRRIGVIEVTEANEKPAYIRQGKFLYIRRGSSNAKASPEEWKTILCAQNGVAKI